MHHGLIIVVLRSLFKAPAAHACLAWQESKLQSRLLCPRSAWLLQCDHLIPVALGGATTVDDLQLLCGECNRLKGASLQRLAR